MNRSARWALAASAVALLASCSATKFAYNRLDWLVSWEIGKYVELEGPSKVLFDSGLASLWQWHRSTQLAAYARDLREIAAAASGPVTPEQIRGYVQRASDHGQRLFEEAIPPTAKVLQALGDEQVKGLLQKMAGERREEAEEDAERSPEASRKRSTRNVSRSMRRWLGGLSDAQHALVRDWAAARRDDPALWKRYGEQWGQSFEQTLAARARPDFEARLREVFGDPQLPDSAAIEELGSHNRENYIGLLAKLAPTLTGEQRRHLRKKLIGLAGDLEELAASRPAA